MTPDQILQAFADGKWLILAIAVITYVTRLTAPDSKFPIHIPTRWAPVVALALGQVLAVLQVVAGGTTAPRAVFNGAVVSFMSMGSFDIVAKAIMGDQPWPQWLKALAFVFTPKKFSAADSAPTLPKGSAYAPTGATIQPSAIEQALVSSPAPVILHEPPITPVPSTKPEATEKPATLFPPAPKSTLGDD